MKDSIHKSIKRIAMALPLCTTILIMQASVRHGYAASPMSDEDILFGFGGKQIYTETYGDEVGESQSLDDMINDVEYIETVPAPAPAPEPEPQIAIEPQENYMDERLESDIKSATEDRLSTDPLRDEANDVTFSQAVDGDDDRLDEDQVDLKAIENSLQKAVDPMAVAKDDNGVNEIPREPSLPMVADDDEDYLPPVKKEDIKTAYAPIRAVDDLQSTSMDRVTRPKLDYDPKIMDVEEVAKPIKFDGMAEGNYTLNGFVQHVMATNPTIELSRLQSELQKLLFQETEANQDFQISGFSNISSEYTSSEANDNRFDNTTRGEAGIRLNRILYSFGAGENQIESSLTTAQQAEIEVEEQENTVTFELATAYLEAIRQRELVEIEKYRLSEHEDFLNLVEKARQTDQVLKSQVYLARTGLAQRKQALLEAERQLKQIEYTLERYANVDIEMADLKKPVIPIVVLPDEKEFIANGLDLSPQIRALTKAVKAAELNYVAAKSSQYGSIDLTANLTGDKVFNDSIDPTVSTDASIEYSVPLYTSGAEESRIKQAQIEVQQAKTNLDFAKKSLTEQLKLAYYVIESADDIRLLAKEEEANSLRVLESFRGEVQQGGRAFSDIIAQIDAVAAGRNRQISSEISKTIAAFAIMRHQGDLLYHLTK